MTTATIRTTRTTADPTTMPMKIAFSAVISSSGFSLCRSSKGTSEVVVSIGLLEGVSAEGGLVNLLDCSVNESKGCVVTSMNFVGEICSDDVSATLDTALASDGMTKNDGNGDGFSVVKSVYID